MVGVERRGACRVIHSLAWPTRVDAKYRPPVNAVSLPSPHCLPLRGVVAQAPNKPLPSRRPAPPPGPATPDKYHWHEFPRQNALLASLLRRDFQGVLLLDVEAASALRIDAHTSSASAAALTAPDPSQRRRRAGYGDCLHWHADKAEGLLALPSVLLHNALQMLLVPGTLLPLAQPLTP